MGERLQQERESPWALTLTERVPEAFEIPPSDWPEKIFSGQSAKRTPKLGGVLRTPKLGDMCCGHRVPQS